MNNDQSTFLAKTQQGLEGFLAEELKALGAQNIVEGRRSVEFEGDQFTLYRVLLASRFALRILKPIFTFRAHGQDSLYKHCPLYTSDAADARLCVDLEVLRNTTKKNNQQHNECTQHYPHQDLMRQ